MEWRPKFVLLIFCSSALGPLSFADAPGKQSDGFFVALSILEAVSQRDHAMATDIVRDRLSVSLADAQHLTNYFLEVANSARLLNQAHQGCSSVSRDDVYQGVVSSLSPGVRENLDQWIKEVRDSSSTPTASSLSEECKSRPLASDYVEFDESVSDVQPLTPRRQLSAARVFVALINLYNTREEISDQVMSQYLQMATDDPYLVEGLGQLKDFDESLQKVWAPIVDRQVCRTTGVDSEVRYARLDQISERLAQELFKEARPQMSEPFLNAVDEWIQKTRAPVIPTSEFDVDAQLETMCTMIANGGMQQ